MRTSTWVRVACAKPRRQRVGPGRAGEARVVVAVDAEDAHALRRRLEALEAVQRDHRPGGQPRQFVHRERGLDAFGEAEEVARGKEPDEAVPGGPAASFFATGTGALSPSSVRYVRWIDMSPPRSSETRARSAGHVESFPS